MSESSALDQLADRVLAGTLSIEAAIERIGEMPIEAETYSEDAVFQSLREPSLLLLRGSATQDPLRAFDLAQLAVAAAARFGRGSEGFLSFIAGRQLEDFDRPSFAEDFYARARDCFRDVDPESELEAECLVLRCRARQTKMEGLLDRAREATQRARDLEPPVLLAVVLPVLADSLSWEGDAEGAVEALEEAIRITEALADDVADRHVARLAPLPTLWHQLGVKAREAGRFERALEAFEKARGFDGLRNPDYADAFLESELGITWEMAGDEARGAEILERAARRAEALGDHRAVARWAKRVSEPTSEPLTSADALAAVVRLFQMDPPQLEAARRLAIETVKRAAEERLRDVECSARNLLGYVYCKEGKFHLGLGAMEEALFIARKAGFRNRESALLINLGLVHLDLGRLEKSIAYLEEGLQVGEELRRTAPSTELRKTVGARLVTAYEQLATLFGSELRWDDGKVERPRPERLLEISQRAQAVNLSAWLRLTARLQQAGSPLARDAARALRGTAARIERAAQAGSPLGSLWSEQRSHRVEISRHLEALGIDWQESASPLAAAELAASLGPGVLLVDLLTTQEAVICALLDSAGRARSLRIDWNRAQRLALLEDWGLALRAEQRRIQPASGAYRGWRMAADPLQPLDSPPPRRELDDLVRELQERVFEPIGEALSGFAAPRRLLVSPHRELYALPFWLLADHFEDCPLSVVPSTSLLPLLRRPMAAGPGELLKVGDVTDTLPFADLETRLLEGWRAVEPEVESFLAAAPAARRLHFAGHGIFDLANPYDSGLALDRKLPPGYSDEIFPLAPEWGRLYRRLTITAILSELDLEDCELVVLSACCTGLPRLHPASEFTSLPAAFLAVGARNVIASLWPAHDGATALLMGELYRCLEDPATPFSPAAALHRARRHLRRMGRAEAQAFLGSGAALPEGDAPLAAPVFQAAFQHYGLD